MSRSFACNSFAEQDWHDYERTLHQSVKGEIDGLISQNPYRMGYLAVQTMVKHLKGEAVEKVNDTGSVLVTKENLPTLEIQNLVKPMLTK